MATPAITPDQNPSQGADQQTPPQQGGATLAQRVKGKFPGAYDDMDDATLEGKILAKHPEYSDLPRTQAKTALTPPAEKPGMLDTVSKKLEDVSNQPLTSHGAATEAGLANVGQGIIQGVQGVAGLAGEPKDDHEKAILSASGPGTLIAYRLGKGLVDSVKSTKDVSGAIKDINQTPDPLGTYASVAGKTAGQAGGQAALAAATEGAVKAVPKVVSAVADVKNLRDVPAAISSDTIDALNGVAKREGLPQVTATTARDGIRETGQNFLKRAKAGYKTVDDAVGGDLKPVQDNIQDLKTGIARTPDLGEKLKLTRQLANEQDKLNALVQRAKASGVPDADNIMKTADTDYAKGKAAERVTNATARANAAGHPHPGGYRSAVDNLQFKGTLQRAFGEDGAQALKDVADEGLSRFKTKQVINETAKHPTQIPGRVIRRGLFGKE